MQNRDLIDKAIMSLFKSYLYVNNDNKDLNNSAFKKGLFFTTDNFSEASYNEAVEKYSLKEETWSQTLYSSFGEILNMSEEQLLYNQILHYYSVYLKDALNDDSLTTYIPNIRINNKEVNNPLYITIIEEISEEKLLEKMMNLLNSGIALSSYTLNNLKILSNYIPSERIKEIKNREFLLFIYSETCQIPSDADLFFKILIFDITNETLIIKSKNLIEKIKTAMQTEELYNTAYNAFKKYEQLYNLDNLAEIFLRYKPLFLAFKVENKHEYIQNLMNKMINRISKLSKKYHKPKKAKLYKNLRYICNDNKTYETNLPKLLKEIEDLNNYQLIGILNYIRYIVKWKYTNNVFKIRNGKTFVSKSKLIISKEQLELFLNLYHNIINIFMKKINVNLDKKIFYIPKDIKYTAPTSEKQFVQNIPIGSTITMNKEDLIIGINWFNLSDKRVDLDLSLVSCSEEFSWRTIGRVSAMTGIQFSRDMTDAPAPKGASEYFYISRGCKEKHFTLNVNDFTQLGEKIEFEVVIAKSTMQEMQSDCIIDPNLVIHSFKCEIDSSANQRTLTIGDILIKDNEVQFTIRSDKAVQGLPSSKDFIIKNYLEYYRQKQISDLSINTILDYCDCTIINEYDREKNEDIIDLSLNKIDKQTIINIFNN